MSDDTKAAPSRVDSVAAQFKDYDEREASAANPAPSLADEFATVIPEHADAHYHTMGMWVSRNRNEILTALRAVDAVPHGGEGISDGALIDGMARDLRTVKAECLRLHRIVDAVRALHVPMTAFGDKHCVLCVNEYSGEPSSWPCDTAKAVGVKAVQALLEGER